MTTSFGNFFKERRISLGITLRQFCEKHGFDPGNISKLERGLFAAPQSGEKLEEYAKALELKQGSTEWIEFFDLAAISSRNWDVMKLKDDRLVDRLPLLFRTLDNKELTAEKLDEIIELIKRA